MKLKWAAIALAVVVVASISLLFAYQTGCEGAIRVTTTTSLYATGLLDKLVEEFQQEYPRVSVQFIAVGSGEALRRAAQGDADIVLVHAPSLEKKYLDEGALKPGKIFAYNYFIIVGPRNDPAGIAGMGPIEAMAAIYAAGEEGRAVFVSRGDNSGTHVRELTLWSMAGLEPFVKSWYIESGVGMSQTLMIANERKAYTLSDIGTYLKLSEDLGELEPLVDKGDILINVYSVYLVNQARVSGVNKKLAEAFVEFILSDEGQKIIGSYGAADFGRPLFNAAMGDPTGELRNAWEMLAESGYVLD